MYLKIGNIPRIIIARGKIFPYICRAFMGNDILKKEVPFIDEIANFKTIDNGTSTCYMVGCLSVSIWAFGDACL